MKGKGSKRGWLDEKRRQGGRPQGKKELDGKVGFKETTGS
jgi:hypothetical protein